MAMSCISQMKTRQCKRKKQMWNNLKTALVVLRSKYLWQFRLLQNHCIYHVQSNLLQRNAQSLRTVQGEVWNLRSAKRKKIANMIMQMTVTTVKMCSAKHHPQIFNKRLSQNRDHENPEDKPNKMQKLSTSTRFSLNHLMAVARKLWTLNTGSKNLHLMARVTILYIHSLSLSNLFTYLKNQRLLRRKSEIGKRRRR